MTREEMNDEWESEDGKYDTEEPDWDKEFALDDDVVEEVDELRREIYDSSFKSGFSEDIEFEII